MQHFLLISMDTWSAHWSALLWFRKYDTLSTCQLDLQTKQQKITRPIHCQIVYGRVPAVPVNLKCKHLQQNILFRELFSHLIYYLNTLAFSQSTSLHQRPDIITSCLVWTDDLGALLSQLRGKVDYLDLDPWKMHPFCSFIPSPSYPPSLFNVPWV